MSEGRSQRRAEPATRVQSKPEAGPQPMRGRSRVSKGEEWGDVNVQREAPPAAPRTAAVAPSYQRQFVQPRIAPPLPERPAEAPAVAVTLPQEARLPKPAELIEAIGYAHEAEWGRAGSLLHDWRVIALIAIVSVVILVSHLASQESRTVVGFIDSISGQSAEARPVPAAAAAVPGENSVVGPPTISADQVEAVLRKYQSPAVGTGKIWIELGRKYNIDPAYALAFFIHESTAGTASGWAGLKPDGSSTHNVGNIICAGYATCYNRFRDYPNWDAGIEDWYRLISTEYVQGRNASTVESIIPVYAPSSENDVPNYINTVVGLVQDWRRGVIR